MTNIPLKIPEIAVAKWRGIADLLADLLNVPVSAITVLEEGQVRLLGGARGPKLGNDGVIKEEPGLKLYCGPVVHGREELVVPDAAASDYWKDSHGAKAGLIAYAGVPIFFPDGDVFGAVCLFDRKPNQFSGAALPAMKQFAEIITGHLELILKNAQLEETLKEVRQLQGLIPICAHCKKIRDDKGFWQKVEVYLEQRSGARFTHGLCEECMHKIYGHEKWFKERDPGK